MSKKEWIYKYYTSKKTGEITEYKYRADRYGSKRRSRSPYLVGKKGNIYDDRVKDLLDSTKDLGFRAQLEDVIDDAAKKKKVLTLKSAIAQAQKSEIATRIMQTGYTVEEAAEELGVSEAELLDTANWTGKMFKTSSMTDAKEFIFQYKGAIFK